MAYDYWGNDPLASNGVPPPHTNFKNVSSGTRAGTRAFFSCWDQFLCMSFAQLTGRENLRDIQSRVRGNQQKLYPPGFRGRVSRNALAHANQIRDWRIYVDFAHVSIGQARILYAREDFGIKKIAVLIELSFGRFFSIGSVWMMNKATYPLNLSTVETCRIEFSRLFSVGPESTRFQPREFD